MKHIRELHRGIVASVVAGLIVASLVYAFENRIAWLPNIDLSPLAVAVIVGGICVAATIVATSQIVLRRPKLWPNRDDVKPSFRKRIRSAKSEIILVGVALDTVVQTYFEDLKFALNSNPTLTLKLLMLDPRSPHLTGHQEFAHFDIRGAIEKTIEGPIKELHHSLTAASKERLEVRLTHFLPRFASAVVDDEILVNLYMFQRRAPANPILEFRRGRNVYVFNCIRDGLLQLFDYDGCRPDDRPTNPNYSVIESGAWIGLPDMP